MIEQSKPNAAMSQPKLAATPQPQHTPGNDLPHRDRQFLTNAQLQEILQLSRRTIFEWRRKGILPSIQIGGSKILYHRESVIAALLRQQKGNVL
jgi:predicted DNA-binding transcriptional regulator AlpA